MHKKINFTETFYNGEMLPYERYKLYNWISEIKPIIIFEVGTGGGGGSTYFISQSIKDNNLNSKIFTCDPIRNPTKEFFDEFPFVHYFKETSQKMLSNLIQLNIKPDFIMFDGPEPPNIAYEDIILLEDVIEDGTYFCMHDWDHYRPYDKNYSTKSVTIREYMENSERWNLQEQLHADIKNSNFDSLEYDSVGLCLYKFKK